jgi:hypothetical protein
MTTGASDWGEVYLSDAQIEARRRTWVDQFRPACLLALQDFLATAEWPEREPFRRKLVQRGLDLSLDELLQNMPRSHWESRYSPPERVVLPFQVLKELPDARELLAVCVAIVVRAYELYRSEEDEPTLRSDDPALLAAAHGDAKLLLCAREVVGQHSPHPLGGGTSGTDSTEWTRTLNHATVPAFKKATSLDGYLLAQERIITEERSRSGHVSDRLPSEAAPAEALASRVDLFVLMPFTQPWSEGVYSFIHRATRTLGAPEHVLHLYRADEIARPGRITDQIKEAIERAHVIIADISDVNPNVMWELGYADGLGKTIVILNQSPGTSPFDMVDRRQVQYSSVPTDADEAALVLHLKEALRDAIGGGCRFRIG